MLDGDLHLRVIGTVQSPLSDLAEAPRQGDEGAPNAWLIIRPEVRTGLRGLAIDQEVIVLTWLHRSTRDVLEVHPRGDVDVPTSGVFATRSPDRPNPIGLHSVRVLDIDDGRVQVSGLEAVHGTPVLDIKPVLGPLGQR